MAKSFINAGPSGGSASFGTTTYISIIGAALNETGPGFGSYPFIVREPGVIRNMWIKVRTNTLDGATTVKPFTNLSSRAQSISVGATLTGAFENTTDVDTIGYGDTLGLIMTAAGTTGAIRLDQDSFEYTSYDPTETISRNGINWYANFPTAASTSFFTPLFGIVNTGRPEADCNARMRQAGLFRYLTVNITVNARATTSTVTLRKNNADSTITVSIGAAATGLFDDLTHTEAVAVNDDYCIATTTGTGAGTLTITAHNISFVTQNYSNIGLLLMGDADTVNGLVLLPGDNLFFPLTNSATDTHTPETTAQNIMRAIDYRFFSLSCHITINSLTASSTLLFRKNTADGNQSISIPQATTGFFLCDNIIDQTAPGDLVNLKITVGATGTAFQVLTITNNYQIPPPNYITFL